MANRKAGSAGDATSGEEGTRPAAGAEGGGGTPAGGAGRPAKTGAATGARKQAAGTRGAAAAPGTGSTPAASRPAETAGRAPAKGAAKSAVRGGARGSDEAQGGAGGALAAVTRAVKGAVKGATRAASKAADAQGAAKKSPGGRGTTSAGRGTGKLDLRADLRQFVSRNPKGWEHHHWLGLLDHLGQRGHDTSTPDQIGMQLERERLSAHLEGVEGVSPQRARSLVERFGTLYSLRNADADQIAREGKVSRDVAERIKSRLG